MNAEIVSVGTEIMVGNVTDTNASFLASQLPLLGIELLWVSQVGDDQPRMVEVLRRAWGRSDLILITGGLGPTADDLTREAIAETLGEKMEISPDLERDLRARFGGLGRAMPPSNHNHATLVPSARGIPNPQGTAPGWWVEKNGRLLIAMPGPPREMLDMWQRSVRPELQKRSGEVIMARTLKTFGLSEAAVGEMAFPLFGENPALGVYAKPDGIHLTVMVKAKTEAEALALLDDGERRIRGILSEHIWGTDSETLESAIGRLLIDSGQTLAVMEDYSGGWLTNGLTEAPDSQRFFKGGLIATSDEAKIALGINPATIARFGGVSAEVAQEMARAACSMLNADVGLSITGIDVRANPAGLVYIGLSDGHARPTLNRPRGRQRAAIAGLFELRKGLLARR
jgi:nicotinamide-nucleotide amidase